MDFYRLPHVSLSLIYICHYALCSHSVFYCDARASVLVQRFDIYDFVIRFMASELRCSESPLRQNL